MKTKTNHITNNTPSNDQTFAAMAFIIDTNNELLTFLKECINIEEVKELINDHINGNTRHLDNYYKYDAAKAHDNIKGKTINLN